jgi:hypothetical protein
MEKIPAVVPVRAGSAIPRFSVILRRHSRFAPDRQPKVFGRGRLRSWRRSVFRARGAPPLSAHCCVLVVFGERPHRARQRRTALCATMGDVLQAAGFRTAVGSCRCDRGDCHAMSAARARKQKTRQIRSDKALERHRSLSHAPVPTCPFPDRSEQESRKICATHINIRRNAA